MEQTLLEQIKERIEILDEKEEYDLSNAWESLKYLMREYDDEVPNDKKTTFKEWYNEQKQVWLNGSGSVTDIDYWISDIEELNGTDILTSDYELFDKYFNLVLDNNLK